MLNFRGLGGQIGLAAGLPMAAAVLIAVVGVSSLRRIERHLDRVVRVSSVKSEVAAEMRLGIIERADAVRNIALTDEIDAMQPDRERIIMLTKRYAKLREKLEGLPNSAEETGLLQAAAAAEAKALPLIKNAQAMAQLMQLEAAAKVLSTKLEPVQRDWVRALSRLAELSAKAREQTLADASRAGARATVAMLAAAGLALAACVLSTTLIVGRSVRRLAQAVQAAEAIAEGELTAPIDVSGGDEITMALRSIARMRTQLRQIISSIRDGIGSVTTASSEIAAGSADLNSRTERQANNLQQTAVSMKQMTGSVGSSAESARQAKRFADAASQVAQRGGQAVGGAVRTMEEIRSSSTKMADIVSVIDSIAFQTNILALNAAVEAARAGDQGRGFAVVAGEVRSLAQRSAEAAKEIKGLIETSMQKVAAGSKLVSAARSTMDEIVAQVQRVDQLIGEISDAAQGQSSDIGQVNAAIAQLDHMTQQNAALVQQSAAAAQGLRTQASRLAESVAVFRIDEAAAVPH